MWNVLLVEPCTPGQAPVVSVNQPAPVFGGAWVSRPWSDALRRRARSSSRKPGVRLVAYSSTASWRRPSEAKNSSLPLSSPSVVVVVAVATALGLRPDERHRQRRCRGATAASAPASPLSTLIIHTP